MIGYLRVSQRMGRFGPGYISPDVQREAVQRWADYRDVEMVEWILDEDQSGRTQNRPGLRRAMAMVESHEADGIACWRLNRFARNVSEALADVKRLQAADGALACVEEDVDPTGPFGSFILTILLAVAALEVENLTAGWRTARERAAARGVQMGPAPFGYRHGAHGVLEVDPHDGPVMAEAFRLAADDGLPAALEHLRERAPERHWRTNHLRRMLARATYRGELIHAGDDQAFRAECPALVSRSVWTRAQSEGAARRPAGDFAMTGLARCSACSGPLHGSTSAVPVYRCGTRTCAARATISRHLLDDYVRGALAALYADVAVEVGEDPAGDLDALRVVLEDADEEVRVFAGDVTARRLLGDGDWTAALEARAQARDDARVAYEEAVNESRPLRVVEGAAWDDLEPGELRALAEAVLAAVVVRRGRGPVADRVTLVPHDADGGAAVAS